MAEGGPGHTHALTIHVKVGTKSLGEQIGHQVDHRIGSECFTAFNPLMGLQLEACQGWHLEEVAEEISADSFLDQRKLEILILDTC